jgi:hypothetical protein
MTLKEIRTNLSSLADEDLRSLNRDLISELKARRNLESARKRHLFSEGDKVSWSGRRGYTEGTVVRVKRKKAIVKVTGDYRNWDVPLNMLEAVS